MQTTTEPKTPKRSKKGGKPNGQTNGVDASTGGDGIIPFPERSEDAPAGEAVEELGPDHYEPPQELEPQELELAGDLYLKLQSDAEEMGIQAVIDALIAIVDVHDVFRTPELFNGSSSDDDKYEVAANVAEVARFLCRAAPRIEIKANHVVFYFRDHEKWTEAGQTVHAKAKKLDGLTRHHTGGVKVFLSVNYHWFKAANPRQKIFAIYHALRGRDEEGGKVATDYAAFFEEPGLFGAGVHEEHVKMARAFVRDAPAHVGDVHQLSLMAGIFDDD